MTNTTFVVTEGDDASIEVCARVFEGVVERNAVVTLQSMDGTALSQGAEPDYEPLTIQLTFTPSMTEICRNVVIVNDVYYESDENFILQLSTVDPDIELILSNNKGIITIKDDEGWCIYMYNTMYIILCTYHVAGKFQGVQFLWFMWMIA